MTGQSSAPSNNPPANPQVPADMTSTPSNPAETPQGSAVAPVSEPAQAPAPSEGGSVEPAQDSINVADLVFPEGMEITDEIRDEFVGILQKGLTKTEQANALIGFYEKQTSAAVQKVVDSYAEQWTQTEESWKQAIASEYPGEKIEQAQAGIAKLLDKYGNKETREAFNITGAGNNPHVFSLLAKIAADLVEKPPVAGNPTNGAQLSRADRMYGAKNG